MEVSQAVVKTLVGMAAVFVALLVLLGSAIVWRGVNISRARELAQENEVLATQLSEIEQRLTTLSDTLTLMTHRDEQVRLVAGLPPTDPEMQQAGIGGPSAEWAARDQLAGVGFMGQRAIDSRLQLDAMIRRANLLNENFAEALDSVTSKIDQLEATPTIRPTLGYRTSGYSRARLHPIYHEARPHYGIDIVAPRGTDIYAVAKGQVRRAQWMTGYGYVVEIDHGNGLVTRYAHCDELKVKAGRRVKRGEVIATVGDTGIATAPHVHYEVLKNGKPVNPEDYILPESIVD